LLCSMVVATAAAMAIAKNEITVDRRRDMVGATVKFGNS
jgi:hypothetical protein